MIVATDCCVAECVTCGQNLTCGDAESHMQHVTASTHTTSTTRIMMPAESTQQRAVKPTKATGRPAKVRKVVQAKVEGEARASWSTKDEDELI